MNEERQNTYADTEEENEACVLDGAAEPDASTEEETFQTGAIRVLLSSNPLMAFGSNSGL